MDYYHLLTSAERKFIDELTRLKVVLQQKIEQSEKDKEDAKD